MHNTFDKLSYICIRINHQAISSTHMKKTTAFSLSSLLLLGGVSYLAAKLADLDLTFFFHGDDDHHQYC
ncbi:hypothetical protein GCM10022407_05400 [Hymenobacter antarcticus]|uniref:Uncharacterized protein n=1 Tax=Hymenobacter antarcticus TaxID=486270 RepID=A0ABP7P8H0_9BACT